MKIKDKFIDIVTRHSRRPVSADPWSIEVCILAHGKWLASAPKNFPFRPINLEALPLPDGVPDYPWLSENIAFLSDVLLQGNTKYLWLASGRHDNKWVEQEGRRTTLEALINFPSIDFIWCTCLGPRLAWKLDDDVMHPGILPLIEEMQAKFALKNRHDTIYANSFCFPRDMFPRFLTRWQEIFWYFHNKYGADLPFDVGVEFDDTRKGSYFYERVTMALIADWPGIQLRQIP